MHSVVFKNDAVGDLVHSVKAINNIAKSSKKTTLFLSKLSEKFSFLISNPEINIKILNYNLSIIEKIKIFIYLVKNKVDNVYILSPKKYYFILPLFFRKIKFYAICVNNINNYKRPSFFLRKFLHKYEINHRDSIFKREPARVLQNRLTYNNIDKSNFKFTHNIQKSDLLNNLLPKKYIYFHFKKKIINELNWDFKDLKKLFSEFQKFSSNVVITKDIEFDEYNNIFKDNFNSYDYKTKKHIDKRKKVFFFDNISGSELFTVLNNSTKIVAFHGMMTNLGFLLGNPVLDLFHCNITSWDEYRRYRNSFYEFKPKHNNYDFVIPKKDMDKTIKKIYFSLIKCN